MAASEKQSPEVLKALEDKVRERVAGWNELRQAVTYQHLNACGMTLEKSKSIRRKAGFNC
jgi:hypothetical protein